MVERNRCWQKKKWTDIAWLGSTIQPLNIRSNQNQYEYTQIYLLPIRSEMQVVYMMHEWRTFVFIYSYSLWKTEYNSTTIILSATFPLPLIWNYFYIVALSKVSFKNLKKIEFICAKFPWLFLLLLLMSPAFYAAALQSILPGWKSVSSWVPAGISQHWERNYFILLRIRTVDCECPGLQCLFLNAWNFPTSEVHYNKNMTSVIPTAH